MAKLLPKNRFLTGIFEPWPAESEIHDLIVQGEIPREISGVFYKNGPNPQYVFSENYHFYEGDAMIHAVKFNNGKASYFNKFIRTEKFNLERAAGRALFAGFRDFGKKSNDPSVGNKRADGANTNVIFHGNKLLAMQESSLPYELNPENLETLGHTVFHNPATNLSIQNSMTAHPKIDLSTGELISYGYINPIETSFIFYYVMDKQGQLIHSEKINVPYLSLLHDFAITENYTVFPLFPLVCNYQRYLTTGEFYAWEPERGAYFGIVPRFGSNKDVIWIHIPTGDYLGIHIVSAYEEDGKIILDAMLTDSIPKGANGFKVDAEETFPSYLKRFFFDLKTQKLISLEKLDQTPGEFPRIDDRFIGKKYTKVFTASTLNTSWSKYYGYEFDGITCYDLENKTKKTHDFGKDSMPVEPIFIPKNTNSKEGDGFVLTYVYRKLENRSDLVILDAQKLDQEPLAIIQFPHRIPFGFHGSWAPRI